MKIYRIAVAGTGYVGLSIATLLSQHHKVMAVDIIPEKVEKINNRISPIKDEYIEKFFAEKDLNLTATLDRISAYKDADFVVIAVPTNYNPEEDRFDTSHIEDVVEAVLEVNKTAVMVIKSTIPIGYTSRLRNLYKGANILFSPEFLRESRALEDLLNPSRIIVGRPVDNKDAIYAALEFGEILNNATTNQNTPILTMGLEEAESVKLFANTYLAMRVAYFNEVDTYAECKGLNTSDIIKGISLDPRIGDYYNNPSFGYGGYCFPKDTKQTLANCRCIDQQMFSAIVSANITRKINIARSIKSKVGNGVVGVYRLAMKSGSDNFRESAIIDVAKMLHSMGNNIVVYEPTITEEMGDFAVCNDLKRFKRKCDIIIANRIDKELNDVVCKVYSRDCFNNN